MNNGGKHTGKTLDDIVESDERKIRDYPDQSAVKTVRDALNRLLDMAGISQKLEPRLATRAGRYRLNTSISSGETASGGLLEEKRNKSRRWS